MSATQFGKGNKHMWEIPKRSSQILKDCEIGSVKNDWMNCVY